MTTQSISVEEYKKLINDTQIPSKSKYRNKKVIVNGKCFDSRMEANYYLELLGQRIAGEIDYFLRQVPLDLSESTKLIYKADFLVFYNDGTHAIIDVKGVETKEFKLKSSLVEARYFKPIILIKKVKNHLNNIPCIGNSFSCINQADFLRFRIRTFL